MATLPFPFIFFATKFAFQLARDDLGRGNRHHLARREGRVIRLAVEVDQRDLGVEAELGDLRRDGLVDDVDQDGVHALGDEVLHLLDLLVGVTLAVRGDDVDVVLLCLIGELVERVAHEHVVEVFDGDAELQLVSGRLCFPGARGEYEGRDHERQNRKEHNLPHTDLLTDRFRVCRANACILGLKKRSSKHHTAEILIAYSLRRQEKSEMASNSRRCAPAARGRRGRTAKHGVVAPLPVPASGPYSPAFSLMNRRAFSAYSNGFATPGSCSASTTIQPRYFPARSMRKTGAKSMLPSPGTVNTPALHGAEEAHLFRAHPVQHGPPHVLEVDVAHARDVPFEDRLVVLPGKDEVAGIVQEGEQGRDPSSP